MVLRNAQHMFILVIHYRNLNAFKTVKNLLTCRVLCRFFFISGMVLLCFFSS